jgi:DNA-binding MarR family transcriptional regulator
VTVSPPLSGIDIGTAASATRALLDRLLNEESLTFEEWVAGFTLLQLGPSVGRDELVRDLAGKLNRDRSSIDHLLVTTSAKELTQESTPNGSALTVFDLTADGFARIQRVRAGTLRIAEELYGPMDPDELRTAGRVLRQVTARAREIATRA